MSNQIEYKCPSCGGPIKFSSSKQEMICEFCKSKFNIEDLEDTPDTKEGHSSEEEEFEEDFEEEFEEDFEEEPQSTSEEDKVRVYVCNSCGGEVVGDMNTAASSCPYCDSPIIMKKSLMGKFKPEYIVPFKLDKKQAIENFSKHLKGKRLLPKVFRSDNHIEEVKGIYVPFWLFDTKVDANIEYKGTTVRHWSDSKYDYTETKIYDVYRGGKIEFKNIPADGSKKMDDTLMESIEPFDFSKAVPFKMAYLSGYLADKFDVSKEQSKGRIYKRVKKSTEEEFKKTVIGYTTESVKRSNVNITKDRVKYAMYPVWILTTNWNNERYMFAMNGQTGKFVGNLPLDKLAMLKWFLLSGVSAWTVSFAIISLLCILGIM